MEEQIKQIVDAYKEYEKDGWTRIEMVKFGMQCIEILIPEAERLEDLDGEDKKRWVIDKLEEAYFAVNPDIPWVPEPLETLMEKFTVRNMLEQFISPAIDWLVAFMKKRGIL